ncbi:sensor domain-containing diguanylate cyclase [Candidatus Nitrotoga sp. M5]|uniref:sensor domain-containing diguanylate cyclase n=1 Tax=Candidatus Nitrotoga sp. M5 TaxID=2890409 RepID=UPI001EF55230|nr:diguanylate cyclase [Candidatus Nitrotoga sp. M5]CAH1388017.1 putative Diguanylate cyclase [Candidatus Nitrotoga sp. M5]
MTFDKSHSNTGSNIYQQLLAANNRTLAHIARGSPLTQTLTCIVSGVEEHNPEIFGAIFLINENESHIHLGAAPSLPENYSRAINESTRNFTVSADQLTEDSMVQITAENGAGQFWRSFYNLALQHGLYVCSVTPIRSAEHSALGIFVAYSKNPDRVNKQHQQSIVDVIALASIAIERDISAAKIKMAEEHLRENETRMALAIDGSGAGIWDRNISTGEIHYSDGWNAMLGYSGLDITSRIEDSYTRVHPDDLASVKERIQAHFDQKTEIYEVKHRIRCKDGHYKWILSRGRVISRDQEGNPLRMIGMTTDITDMQALSNRLQQNIDLITCLTNEISGLVFQYCLLPNGTAYFSYVSEGIRDIYEITPDQAVDDVTLVHKAIHPDDLGAYCDSLEVSAATLMPWHFEYRVILPKQGLRWRHGDARPCRMQDGSIMWHGLISDITERKRREFELQEFATIDFLTQLPNRRYFMARMEEELARIQSAAGTYSAVLMCDLDQFKIINDSYGHATGDLVLKHFATILRDKLRKSDTVGRVGGEEFAIVLSNTDITEANIFAKRVQKQMAETPLVKSGASITVTVSIGIAVMNESDTSADAPLSRSDMALYQAKENGRNRIEIATE